MDARSKIRRLIGDNGQGATLVAMEHGKARKTAARKEPLRNMVERLALCSVTRVHAGCASDCAYKLFPKLPFGLLRLQQPQ